MVDNCCGSCFGIVTTTAATTTPACPGEDTLPCLDIQILTTDADICDEDSAFV